MEKNIFKHETKKHILIKFLFILIIFLSYFCFIAFKYGVGQGVLVTALTWSFFGAGVECVSGSFVMPAFA